MSALPLITIDGPSASGKSSVSREVAGRLGWPWVSTGAFYRGLAFCALKKQVPASETTTLIALANDSCWKVEMAQDNTQVFLQNRDVTSEIGGEQVGAMASQISAIPGVRQALLERQRRCFEPDRGLVAEGRDCGTVVFPQAEVKIYLTANPALRALRRSEQETGDLEETLKLQQDRDAKDSQRQHAPLKVAGGALTIDSSDLSLQEVVTEVLNYAQSFGVAAKS